MPDRRLFILGGFRIEWPAPPVVALPARARALLARLALQPGQAFNRAHLAGLLWPDQPEDRARRNLSDTLYRLRQSLPDLLLITEEDSIAITAGSLWVDVAAFESHAAANDPESWAAAIELYAGDLLEGFYDEWLLAPRTRLREIYLQALERLITALESAGQLRRAVDYAHRLTVADPLNEAAHGAAIRLYARLGQPAAALQQYDRLARLLADELDIEPLPETRALADTLRAEYHSSPGQAERPRPFVGRRRERAALLHLAEQAQDGRGSLVLVEGEPGIGKTRLLEAVAEGANWRGLTVVWGRAREWAGAAPYAPLDEALHAALAGPRVDQVRPHLTPDVLDALAGLIPRLRGVTPDALLPSPDLPAALAALLGALSELAPHVLIFDDAQWAEDSFWEVVRKFAPSLATQRLLVVLSYRDDELRADSTAWHAVRDLDRDLAPPRMTLAGLALEECGELVQALTATLDVETLHGVHRQTRGNPLFVREALEQPEHGSVSLHGLLERRWMTLGPLARVALEAGAVLGRELTHGTWQALAGAEPLAEIPALVAGRFIEETEHGYLFQHDVMREYIYRAVPPERRRDWHRRAGEVLARERVEPAQLAWHFEQAEDWPQAVRHHTAAGAGARARHAYAAAVQHLTSAIALCDRAGLAAEERFDLFAARELALDVLGDRRAQSADLDALGQLAQDDPQRLAKVQLRRAWLLNYTSQYDASEAAANEALALARQAGEDDVQVSALIALGMVINLRDEPARAVPHLQAAVELSQQLSDLKREAEARKALANALLGVRRYAEARAEGETALALLDVLNDRLGQAEMLGTLGIICVEHGESHDGEAYYRRALDICRTIGYRRDEARNLLNLGNLLYALGQVSPALTHYDEAAVIFQAIGHGRGAAMTRLNTAVVRGDILGEDEAAARDIEIGLRYARQVGERSAESQALQLLGNLARRHGDRPAARGHLSDALVAARDVGDRWLEMYGLTALAQLALDEGRFEEALELLATAENICREIGVENPLAGVLLVKGQVLLAAGRVDAALPEIERALTYLEPGTAPNHLAPFVLSQVLAALGRSAEARSAVERAYQALLTYLHSLSPEAQRVSLERVPEHRDIVAAWRAVQPQRITVRLARGDAPLGKTLGEADQVEVQWTLDDGAVDAEVLRREGKAGLRRHRIQRLIDEARAQGALPTDADLARALGVAVRTIERDMLTIQTAGHAPPTRRRK